MMRILLPSKNFSCPKAGEISDPQKAAIQKKQVAADVVSVLIVNVSSESRITILIGLLRVKKCDVLRGVDRPLASGSQNMLGDHFLKINAFPGEFKDKIAKKWGVKL